MYFVSRFLKGNWISKAKLYAFNPSKLKKLLLQLGSCMSRKGLLKIKDNLILLRDYLSDIVTGKYKEYNGKDKINNRREPLNIFKRVAKKQAKNHRHYLYDLHQRRIDGYSF